MESPAQVNDGVFSIDAVGAFSYFGGQDSRIDHVAMIGRFCAIAAGVTIGPHEHPTDFLSAHPLFEGASAWAKAGMFQAANRPMIQKAQQVLAHRRETRFAKVEIGHDVWIGEGAFIRRGVTIGSGAVIAARSVVRHDVPPYAVVAGVPARIVRYRFDPAVIADLEELRWWRYGLSALDGVDFTDIGQAITTIDQNIAAGRAVLYDPVMLRILPDETVQQLQFDRATGCVIEL